MHGQVAEALVLVEDPPVPAFYTTHDDGAEGQCLAGFLTGLSKELAADGLLVVCHHDAEPPLLLFSDGECHRDSDVERSLIRCAARSLEEGAGKAEGVATGQEHLAGTVFTAALTLHNLAITLTGLLRDKRSGPLGVCRDRLAGLLPIAWPFFRIWSQRRQTANHVCGLEAALDASGSGTLLLDRSGRLLFANSSGREFLASGRGLSSARGRLTASNLTETLRLNVAIEHLCSSSRSDKQTTPVLAIKRRNKRPLMITLASADAKHGGEGGEIIVARVFDPEHDLSEIIGPACRYYGLSPGEARLTRYIAEGHTLAAAAAVMGVREQTARSYLKQIFLKTETNRQAELVALMLRSAVRLAPRCRTQVF